MGHLDSYKNFECWDFSSKIEYPDMNPDSQEINDFVLQGKSTDF